MAFENYVGRVGGLALALGIGAAVATGWSCPAWANETAGSAGTSTSGTPSSGDPSGSTETKPEAGPGAADSVAGKDDSQSGDTNAGSGDPDAEQSGAQVDNNAGDEQAPPDVAEGSAEGSVEGSTEPEPEQQADPTPSAVNDDTVGHRASRKAVVVDTVDTSEAKVAIEVDPTPAVQVAQPADVAETPAAVGPVDATPTQTTTVTPAAFVAAAPAAPEEPETIIAAVADLTDTDVTQTTPGPAAPLQAATVVAALAAVRDELEQGSVLRSANLVLAQQVPAVVDATPNVLVIGVDGTNLSRILANLLNANFFGLMQDSTTAAASIVGHTTISNPSWTTILTGVWGETTGVYNNVYNPAVYDSFPTVFTQLETANSAISTTAIADWDVISAIAGSGSVGADHNYYVPQVAGDTNWLDTDDLVGAATVAAIAAANPDVANFIFSYFVGVDENGHMYSGGSQQYADAITNVDENLGLILQAIAASGQQWTILVVTDHGHTEQLGIGHGFQTPDETSTFVIANNPVLFTPGSVNPDYSIADITPTVLGVFGVTPAPNNGVSLTTLGGSTVTPDNDEDALRAALEAEIATNQAPDAITSLVLAVRTLVGGVPYIIDEGTKSIVATLQGIVDQQIFLVSALAQMAMAPVQFIGDVLYAATNVLAQFVATLTGVSNTVTVPLLPPPLPPFEIWPPQDVNAMLVSDVCGVPGANSESSCGDAALAV